MGRFSLHGWRMFRKGMKIAMSQKRKSSRRPRKGILSGILCTILMFTGFLCCFAARWYLFTCGDQSFNAMLFTLFSGISGTDQQILESFILGPLLLALCCTVFLAALFCQRSRFHLIVGFLRHEVTISPISHGAYCWICAILFLSLLIPAEEAVGLREWISNAKNASTLFDTEYIDPAQTRIAFPQKKRNLIYLYLESMETGCWLHHIHSGDYVEKGQELGRMVNVFGETITSYYAEQDGVILYICPALAAPKDTVLVAYGKLMLD